MLLNRLIPFYWVVLSLYNLSTYIVIATFGSKLLNANRVPLTALTAPGNFYFLEFPVNENDSQLSPICADGSPYSFAFRRGTDEHVSKLLIEFEGGPACWNNSSGASCCDGSNLRKQVPWFDYLDYFQDQVVFQRTFPELGSCRGIPSGFLAEAADVVLSNSNAITNDLPIPLRGDQGKGWWESLGGGESDIRDWSYILLPHCSMDWHLGHQENPQITTDCSDGTITKADAVYHRGGTNVDAVIKWVQKQFPSGLDALVTTAGGKIGGCNDILGPTTASSIAPAILAAKLSPSENNLSPPRSSMLVVTEGSGLWDPDLPSPETMANRWNAIDLPSGAKLPGAMDTFIESSINRTQFIWMASNEEKASDDEKLWFMRQTNIHLDKFHVYQPQSKLEKNQEKIGWCPLYTFPDSDPDVADFFANVIKSMSWSSASSLLTSDSATKLTLSLSSSALATSSEPRSRLTFLTIFILICGIVLLAWVIYYIVKVKNSQNGKKVTLSPTDLWFIALTKYPLAFFFVSLLVPIILSSIAFSQNEFRVNMDFNSYLQVNTDLENVKRNYNVAQENQQASLEIEEANCLLHGNSIFGNRKLLEDIKSGDRVDHEDHFVEESMFGNRNLLDELDLDIQIDQKLPLNMLSSHHRELVSSNLNYFSGGEWISIMYQNRKGGNVFEPDVLKAIYEFESSIYEFPGFSDYCFGFGVNRCLPIDSLVSYFFNNGKLVSNIDAVLGAFLVNQPALWKLDQYFGPDNLQSNVTRSFVFLKNMGGDQSAAHPFLRSFYRDFLLKHDQKKTYPAMVHTWNNFILKQTEADDALLHDTLWSIGSLCFVALMILLKVQSVFVALSSMLGLILAFSVAYYWVSAHFLIQDITLIWVAGLFVMLGIGADDIFLMVDSFDHTKHEFDEEVSVLMFYSDISTGDDDPDDRETMDTKIEILQKRMIVAYKKAGSMMLVSSVTTAICFFSNAFGVLTVIQEFGIFMGMVVLINYLHVMTILPSSILVNEIYMAPVQKEFVMWFKQKFLSNKLDHGNECGESVEKNTSPEEPNASEGHEKMKNIVEKSSNDMNSLDRYLVRTYAPFVTRRSSYLIGFPILLAIVLGVFGAMNFSMNDGTILLFSSKYNLGRLEKVTDLYFNDDEDVYTTIEEDNAAPTFAPRPQHTPVPQPTPTISPEERESLKIVNASVTITFIPPEEAVNMGLPGAVTMPPQSNGSSNSAQSVTIGGSSSQQVGGAGSNEAAWTSSSGNQVPTIGLIPEQTSDTGMRRRETIQVKLIWGVQSVGQKPSLWITNTDEKRSKIKNGESSLPSLKLAEARTQEWLIEVVEMAKTNPQLFVRQSKLTWIERLRDFATYAGVEFPIPEHLFTTYVQLLKLKDPTFAESIQNEIGTSAPGLAGDFTFVSVTMMVDAVQAGNAAQNISMSEQIYNEWTEFAAEANKLSPPELPKVVAQSSIFLDAYRVEATIDSTLVTWFVANGLCLLVILLFLQNLALSSMVMVTIILILFCLGGLLFAVFRVPFGPVEALGVSIFIGLSANYSLHVVHAYHHSRSDNRENKIKEAMFAVGSPIVASALSTMGASAFLFGCRTWVFIELGLLICSITGMALLFTMIFLFAWLASAGPLPIDQYGQGRSHQWDLGVLCCIPCQKVKMNPFINSKSEQPEDNRSLYSIEIVRNQDKKFPVKRKRNKKQAEVAEANDNDSVYSIEIVEDLDDDAQQPEKEAEDPYYVAKTVADPNDRKTKKTNDNNTVEKTAGNASNIDETDYMEPKNDEVALRLHVLGI